MIEIHSAANDQYQPEHIFTNRSGWSILLYIVTCLLQLY